MPARHKLRGLDEKHVLKRAFADLVPAEILRRPKQPYRSPDGASFFGSGVAAWVGDVVDPDAVRAAGVFDPDIVRRLVEKFARAGARPAGNADNMRILAVLSTQLLYRDMIVGGHARSGGSAAADGCLRRARPSGGSMSTTFGPTALDIDAPREVQRITEVIRATVERSRRKGIVVAVSGGIDSSVVAALAVAALGPGRVFALHMPERESADETLPLSTELTDSLQVDSVVEDISPMLAAFGCYERRDAAIRRVVPEYGVGYRSKIVLPSVVDSDAYRLYSVVVEDPDGNRITRRLTAAAYLEIVAATNFKQRTRKMIEYFHADRLNYVVAGTPNRLEYDQGFFVKLGDGAADVKPIAHLYKTQVYALAAHLGRAHGDPQPPLDHRHLLAAAVAGGVLLLAAVPPHGPVPLRAEPRRARRGGRHGHGA